MRSKSHHIIIITVLIALSLQVFGQMANYKSLYIYNFIKRIEWPESNSNQDKFYVVVFGDSETADALNMIASTKKAGTRGIEVIQIDELSELEKADLILVGYNKRKELKELNQLIHLSPVLIVADYKNAIESDINLIETDDGLEFLIRPESIRAKGLKLSDSLILLGKQENK